MPLLLLSKPIRPLQAATPKAANTALRLAGPVAFGAWLALLATALLAAALWFDPSVIEAEIALALQQGRPDAEPLAVQAQQHIRLQAMLVTATLASAAAAAGGFGIGALRMLRRAQRAPAARSMPTIAS